MTLIITATGQPAQVEEVTESGYYLTVAGHSRYFDSDLVQHPAPVCPTCGSELGTILLRAAGNRYVEYYACRAAGCDFQKRIG